MNNERQSTDASSGDPSLPSEAGGSGSEDRPDLEPMTFSVLGRFFAVPLLIIGAIVGGAVLVVVLFGGPSAPHERPLDELVQALEATTGESSFGMLLTREKEHWQTALELSVRLKEKEKEPDLTEERLENVAGRLAAMIRTDLGFFDQTQQTQASRSDQLQIRSKRLEFMIHALGRTGCGKAVETLIDIVRSGREPFVQVALQELAEQHEMPETRPAIEPIVALLGRGMSSETRLIACTALSVLAAPSDATVIEALSRVRLEADGDVAWSAALALARLGSSAGKSTLLDLLDRSFLESDGLFHVDDKKKGTVHRFRIPPQRVDEILIAAVDAASHLDDADLWEMIRRLHSDPSPTVRAKVGDTLTASGGVAAVGSRSELED